MARSLGTFGVTHDDTPDDFDTFNWFGSDVKVVTAVNEVELVDLMEQASAVDVDDLASMTVVKGLFRLVIAGDDFDAFWRVAKEQRQTIAELAQLFQTLISEIVDRPTRQPSDSSAGLLTTGESSQPSSTVTASRGRPDLQVIHEDYASAQQRALSALTG
jgi:hypothetical protein